ncbi:Hydrogenase expression/formation protein HypE [Planctomycetes bacterium Pan216]|uniref:Hydrogenase expression/formation protein HypE n=1 Tax=Kolteria novifilia TaxID=2527975 RepID=A0A518BBQ6_9BACT|nr:Hydrogenase expression/formation protein HypE [Planctomycetes bacterium Pan216]
MTSAFRDPTIQMAHGAGGQASRRLIEGLLRPAFGNDLLDPLADAALLPGGLALTTDSFVVHPLAFPGGSIGELAVHGTINDLAVSGATPIALTASLILEAGLEREILEREVRAMAEAANRAGCPIATGDTKVVEHGKADGLYINTTGLGRLHPNASLGADRVTPGDKILLSGAIADHGVAIMLARDELAMESDVRSDTRSVLPLTTALLDAWGAEIKWMRDATRGGIATVLNELAHDADVGVVLTEEAVPIHDAVRGACELLGLEPYHVANEGQYLAVVSAAVAEEALEQLRAIEGGDEAALIGEVSDASRRLVLGKTPFGGTRVIDMLIGDPLPRIC